MWISLELPQFELQVARASAAPREGPAAGAGATEGAAVLADVLADVLATRDDGRGLVLQVDGALRARGIAPGMTVAQARARGAGRVLTPVPQAVARVHQQVIEALVPHVPRLESGRPGRILADPEGLQWRGRSPEDIARVLLSCVQALGLQVRAGVGSGRFVAWVAAVHAPSEPPETAVLCVPADETQRFLSQVSLQALTLPAEVRLSMETLGLLTLGDLAQLAAGDVEDRYGAEGLRAWHLARGDDLGPFPTAAPEPRLVWGCFLEDGIHSLETLCFVLRSPLEDLLDRARRERGAVETVRISLGAPRRDSSPRPPWSRDLGLDGASGVSLGAHVYLELLRLELERPVGDQGHRPELSASGGLAIRLEVIPAPRTIGGKRGKRVAGDPRLESRLRAPGSSPRRAPDPDQGRLFGGGPGRVREPLELSFARLSTRWGEGAVRRLRTPASQRPEAGTVGDPFGLPEGDGRGGWRTPPGPDLTGGLDQENPVDRLPLPEGATLRLTPGPGTAVPPPDPESILEGPVRLSGEWWAGALQAVAHDRDYFRVAVGDRFGDGASRGGPGADDREGGQEQLLYRDRIDGTWYLQGTVD